MDQLYYRGAAVYHAPDPEPPPRLERRVERPDHDMDRPWFDDQELDQDSPQHLPAEPWLLTAVGYGLQCTPERVTCWIHEDFDANDRRR